MSPQYVDALRKSTAEVVSQYTFDEIQNPPPARLFDPTYTNFSNDHHIYNRGVNKATIFHDEQDYKVFLSLLKEYLSPQVIPTPEEFTKMTYRYLPKNYYREIELKSYCLIPNHLHLLIKQKKQNSIELFMRSLCTRFVQYYNKRYKRIGPLFQSVYKGKLITNDEYLLWLTRYIHRNPIEILPPKSPLSSYSFSSYPAYLGLQNVSWLKFEEIKSQIRDYKNFVEDNKQKEPELLGDIALDKESPYKDSPFLAF